MTSPRVFARILIAGDGEQVLFLVDKFGGQERLQACTPRSDEGLVTHTISFDVPDLAQQLLEAVDVEQANIMRQMAFANSGGGGAELLKSLGAMQ